MIRIIWILILSGLWVACGNRSGSGTEKSKQPEAIPAGHFTALFDRHCCGFTGGDGTYSVELPDGRTVWIFGDTFLGSVNPDGTREKQTPLYARNTFVVQDGDSMTTLFRGDLQDYASLVIPPPEEPGGELLPEDSVWFWPGDGYVDQDTLYVFMSEFIKRDTGMWGFEWTGTWLAKFSLPAIKQVDLVKIPHSGVYQVHYGHAVYPGEDFIYTYGLKDKKPHTARYPKNTPLSGWRFYDGTGWSANPEESRAMNAPGGSEQFSVIRIGNVFAYISQEGFLSDTIYSMIAPTPCGPWRNKKTLYETPIPFDNENLFSYNAVAHPQFTRDSMLLVSYNINSMKLADHFRNADIYRPRFIWVPIRQILEE